MTPAELKTIREACGLSVADLAHIIRSPKSKKHLKESTIRKWENDNSSIIPDDVENLLLRLEADILTYSHKLASKYISEANTLIILRRYKLKCEFWQEYPIFKGLPTSYHAAILYRARKLLEKYKIQVCIDY